MRAWNRTRNVSLVTNGSVAATPWTRLRGLLGHRPLQTGEGLLLRGEQAIHTVGMGFAIDVLFLNRDGTVVGSYERMEPLRFSRFIREAADVLELPEGTLERTGTVMGDLIELELPTGRPR